MCRCECYKGCTKIFKVGSKFMSEFPDNQGKEGNMTSHETSHDQLGNMTSHVFIRQRHAIFTDAALDLLLLLLFWKDKGDIETICFRLCAIW